MTPLRTLVGCEESGAVRRQFAALGHDAWSCDLIPARDSSPNHLMMDVFDAIINHGPWDIIILHPPCTALCVSGNRTYGTGKPKHNDRINAIAWTQKLWATAIKHARKGCALENPVGVIWQHIGQPQYIHPWQFGHPEQKKTGILTHNLPPLTETNNVYQTMVQLPSKLRHRMHYMSPGPNRSKYRSETYSGIAEAMAWQWS